MLPLNPVVAKNVSVGIYAIVDEVTFEPEGDSPNLVRISGVFVVPPLSTSGSYRKFVPFPNPNDPQGNPHHSLEVRVHAESGGPAAPDFYPMPQPGGVTEVKGWDKDYDPDCDKIAAALRDASHR